MPELRRDPVTQQWVIIAPERGLRPKDFQRKATVVGVSPQSCPFCPGNESKTPPEVYAVRLNNSRPNTPGWQVRVVPNKFPIPNVKGELRRWGFGLFDLMNAIGAHEVVIETPKHFATPNNLSDFVDWDMMTTEQVKLVFRAYQQRLLTLRQDERFLYLVVFRNYGEQAGATLSHPHSQILTLPFTPGLPKRELDSARRYYLERQRCLFCDLIYQERELQKCIVWETEHIIVLSPFAARFPYELHFFPKQHSHDFALADEGLLADLAEAVRMILMELKPMLIVEKRAVTKEDFAYNFILHTAPNTIPRPGRPDYWGTLPYDYHWHFELIPCLTHIGGVERGVDCYINPVSPEAVAEDFRKALAEPATTEVKG